MSDPALAVDAVWRLESARIIAALTRLVHDVGLAEELAQDALVAALEQWPSSGVPDNPGAWLMAIAKRRAIDHIRRSQRLEQRTEQLARDADQASEPERDDVLRLMFISCHPVLATEARIALTLRLVGGLTAAEIARAFLVNEPTIAQRLAAAKRTLAAEQVAFELPDGPELVARLSSVLEVIYLIFNEGYSATSGDDLIRPDLYLEALRLGRLLAELAPGEAEVHGLVALMEIQASRSAARTGPSGELVQLHEQNRGQWDQLLIRRGFTAMLRAKEAGGAAGPYVLQAAIAISHAQARTAQDTDWTQIASLYDALAVVLPTPIVRLNQAVAVGRARGPREGLILADALVADPKLQNYHLLPGVRADLLLRAGRHDEARAEFERAASLARNAAERTFLRRRADEIAAAPARGVTLGQAAADFLGRDDLDPGTVRSYQQTMRRLCLTLGERLPLASLTAGQVAQVFLTAWDGSASKTWNRHRATMRSFAAWAGVADLAANLDRRAETNPRTASIGLSELEALWTLEGPSVRERALWRMVYESTAGASTVLSLDVQDLDLDDRRARVGDRWVNWRAVTARLLADLIAGRTRGPLFLADRRPGPARARSQGDLCPDTGRGRLSYERAEYLFKQATRTVDPTGAGYTLRQLAASD